MTKVILSETCGQESDLKQAIPANYNFIDFLLPKSSIYDSSVFVYLLESFLRGQHATQWFGQFKKMERKASFTLQVTKLPCHFPSSALGKAGDLGKGPTPFTSSAQETFMGLHFPIKALFDIIQGIKTKEKKNKRIRLREFL